MSAPPTLRSFATATTHQWPTRSRSDAPMCRAWKTSRSRGPRPRFGRKLNARLPLQAVMNLNHRSLGIAGTRRRGSSISLIKQSRIVACNHQTSRASLSSTSQIPGVFARGAERVQTTPTFLAGIIKQFSLDYPKLTVEFSVATQPGITTIGPSRFAVGHGEYIWRNDR